jgi:hypothetical protein
MGIELQPDKCTPKEIFQVIDNQSVNRAAGEILIERYGDRRVIEAVAGLQEKTGIELNEEMGKRVARIGQLIDKIYEKI